MKVIGLLKQRKLLSKEIRNINFHMELLECDVDYLKEKISFLKDKSDDEIVKYIVEIFKRCNELNDEYDDKLDEEMTRICLQTDDFYSENYLIKEDYDENHEISSIYDDYIDIENELKR